MYPSISKTITYSLIIFFSIIQSQYSYGQIWNKVTSAFNKNTELILNADEITQIRSDINTLCSPNLQGRRAGTKGEEQAGVFLEQRFNALGIKPLINNSYRQHFKFESNKKLSKNCKFIIGNKYIFIPEDATPLAFSNFSIEEDNFAMPYSEEPNAPWIIPLYNNAKEASDPNFDWEKAAYLKALKAQQKGASSVILFDEFGATNKPVFKSNSSFASLNIIAIIINKNTYEKHVKNIKTITPITINIEFSSDNLIGTNIVGIINNNASQTIIIGAHYDHLGENKNIGRPNAYFPGADKNASGVAAMLALASRINRTPDMKQYNYIFIAFSAHENGLIGAKSFTQNYILNNKVSVVAMINLDRVGKIKNNKNFSIEGIGSALAWEEAIAQTPIPTGFSLQQNKKFNINAEHIEFYTANIPSILITAGNNDNHNTMNDYPNTLNYDGITNITNYALQLIHKLCTNNYKFSFKKIASNSEKPNISLSQ